MAGTMWQKREKKILNDEAKTVWQRDQERRGIKSEKSVTGTPVPTAANERLHAFGRHAAAQAKAAPATATPTDAATEYAQDRTNRFQQHDATLGRKPMAANERRHAFARHAEEDKENQKRIDARHETWVNKHRATSTGTHLDAETLKLKAASDADRLARRNPVTFTIPSPATLAAIVAG